MDNGTCTFFDPISTITCENICTNYNLQGGGGGNKQGGPLISNRRSDV